MARSQQRKGARVEREIVRLHQSAGIPALRVPLPGSTGVGLPGELGRHLQGDVKVFPDTPDELTAEVKARKAGCGFTLLERWLTGNDLLFLKRNARHPGDRLALIVAMPWDTYQRLLSGEAQRQGA